MIYYPKYKFQIFLLVWKWWFQIHRLFLFNCSHTLSLGCVQIHSVRTSNNSDKLSCNSVQWHTLYVRPIQQTSWHTLSVGSILQVSFHLIKPCSTFQSTLSYFLIQSYQISLFNNAISVHQTLSFCFKQQCHTNSLNKIKSIKCKLTGDRRRLTRCLVAMVTHCVSHMQKALMISTRALTVASIWARPID